MRFHSLAIPITGVGSAGTMDTYSSLVAQAVAAERRGFTGFWVGEHHFGEYGGAVPLVGVMLAHLAAHTSTIRLGAGVAVLSLRPDPIATVEEFAMVDGLSRGRLDLGVGRGFMDHEFAGKGIAPAERAAAFEQNLSLLEQFCAGTGTTLGITPRPVQSPIPLWIAVSTNLASCRRAAAGGHSLMLNPGNRRMDETQAAIETYLESWSEEGRNGRPRILVNQFLYTASTEGSVRAGAETALNSYLDSIWRAMDGPSSGGEFPRKVFDDLYPDKALIGTPVRIAEKIAQWQEMGVTDISLMTHFGAPASSTADESADLFADEVMTSFPEG